VAGRVEARHRHVLGKALEGRARGEPDELGGGDGPVPAAQPSRVATLRIANRGRFPASLSSHVPLQWASPTLEFPRAGLAGARLRLPAGAAVRIEPGAEIDVEVMWS